MLYVILEIMREGLSRLLSWARPYIKLEYIFLIVFLIFGALFIYITPPGQNPDEFTHVYRAIEIANGHPVAKQYSYKGKQYIGAPISKNVNKFFADWQTFSAYSDPSFRFNKQKDLQATSNLKEDRGDTVETDFSNAAVYSPVAYIPQVIAVWLSRIFNTSIFTMIMLGRVLGLIAVGLVVACAIRLIPIGKWALFVVGLLPETVSQSAAFSADGMTMAATIICIAYILRVALQKRLPSCWQLVTIFLLCALVGVVKPSYEPVIVLVALIPILHKPMRSKKILGCMAGLLLLSLVPFLLWTHEIGFIKTIHSDFNPTANYYTQKSLIEHQPVTYAHILYRTFFTDQQYNTYRSLFGDFSWASAPLPPIFVFVGTTVLVLSMLVQSPREPLWRPAPRQLMYFRMLAIAIFLICILVVATALYLSFDDIYRSSIDGFQGRYLIPPLLLFLLAFYGNKLQKQKTVKLYMLLAVIIVLLAGVVTAYSHYYLTVPPYVA